MKKLIPSIATFRYFLISFGVISLFSFYLFRVSGTTYNYFTAIITSLAFLFNLFALATIIFTLGKGRRQIGFILIFLGILSALIGEISWFIFTLRNEPDLATYIPTIFFTLTYLFNTLGFVQIAWLARVKIFEFIGVVVGFFFLTITLLTISNAVHPISLNLFNAGYLIGDALRVIIISLILQIIIIYQGGLLGRYWLSLFIGNIFIIIGNFTQSLLVPQYFSAAWPFTLIDIIYLGGYLFVCHGYYGIADTIRTAQMEIVRRKSKS